MSDTYAPKRPLPLADAARHLVLIAHDDPPIIRRTSTAALLQTVERLEQVIELETATLKQSQPADLRDFNAKKSQGLLELNRMLKSVDQGVLVRELREPLGRLREKLDRNLHMLQNHLRAVREVARVIASAIQDSESDGTYSLRSGGWQGRE
jgi:hypothetical protein